MKKDIFAKPLRQFFDSKDILFRLNEGVYICNLKNSQYINLPKTLEADIEIYLYKKTKVLANALCTPHDKNSVFLHVTVLNPNNNKPPKKSAVV